MGNAECIEGEPRDLGLGENILILEIYMRVRDRNPQYVNFKTNFF